MINGSIGADMFSWIIFVMIAVLAVAFLSGRFTAEYAAQKGRSKRVWFFWGALFFPLFPIPWMVLGLLPRK
jgi:hypothetical protein